jgi:hypothetical protein
VEGFAKTFIPYHINSLQPEHGKGEVSSREGEDYFDNYWEAACVLVIVALGLGIFAYAMTLAAAYTK